MTDTRRTSGPKRSARHEQPAIDELALEAARWADQVLAALQERGSARWISYFEPIPDRLRDDEPAALRATAIRCRAAYGVKDSIRDVAPWGVTEPFLDAVDRLLREINRSRG